MAVSHWNRKAPLYLRGCRCSGHQIAAPSCVSVRVCTLCVRVSLNVCTFGCIFVSSLIALTPASVK